MNCILAGILQNYKSKRVPMLVALHGAGGDGNIIGTFMVRHHAFTFPPRD